MSRGEVVVEADPALIIGSGCGKRFVPYRVRARPGFDQVMAVRAHILYETKSPLILAPGPAALTDGLSAVQQIIGTKRPS